MSTSIVGLYLELPEPLFEKLRRVAEEYTEDTALLDNPTALVVDYVYRMIEDEVDGTSEGGDYDHELPDPAESFRHSWEQMKKGEGLRPASEILHSETGTKNTG
ncbi:MAG: hypothetical protein SF029_09010 [bacterium]|nr:hypothetical protein [bacterium]